MVIGFGDEFKPWTKLFMFLLALLPLEKAWIHQFSPSIYGWIVVSLVLVMQPIQEKEDSAFKPASLRLKTDLVSNSAHGGGVG